MFTRIFYFIRYFTLSFLSFLKRHSNTQFVPSIAYISEICDCYELINSVIMFKISENSILLRLDSTHTILDMVFTNNKFTQNSENINYGKAISSFLSNSI